MKKGSASVHSNRDKAWYAFYVKPRHEKKASARLKDHYEIYCPIREQRVRWSDRWKTVKKPLIPGYLFANVNEKSRIQILNDPSIFRTVCWKGKPAKIRQDEIDTMKKITGHPDVVDLSLEPFQPGDWVTIKGGELVDLDGTIVRVKGGKAKLRLDSLHSNLTFTVDQRLLQAV
ncbi:MAG: UpxY family transcription antiterminator [Balneolaceae bacterium]|nr:UpxY family transcription antiterminator [Balneolaceae bacterium]